MSEPFVEYENLANSNREFLADLKQAAAQVIDRGWYVLGDEVRAFEGEFASYVGARHCVGVANGLDALILSIEALQLPKGSEILVAANTYIATILAILRAGHVPVLIEPVRETFNIDPSRLRAALTSKTRAICVTHLFGKTCRMDEICLFAREHCLRIVEDCAQSHGAKLNGKMTGTFGDAGCFSFYPTKNLGAVGDAGAIVTDDDALAERLRHLRNYGSLQKYVNRYVGVNSRLDEIQAAILRVKLRHLDVMTRHKRELSDLYFQGLPSWLGLPVRRDDEFDVFHIFGVRVRHRDALRQYLLQRGIRTEVHYPVPPYSQDALAGMFEGQYPISDELHLTELSLPISVGHRPDEIMRVVDVVSQYDGPT